MFAAGCKKKAAVQQTPAPPKVEQPAPAPAPPQKPVIASFTAEPATIERGQSSTLRWSVQGATQVKITPGLDFVVASDNRQVYPSSTTTYELVATGPGGNARATATVNVTVPAPPPPAPVVQKKSLSERLATEIQDAYFDYDKSDIREDARAVLSRNSDALKAILADYPGSVILVEGHCDERGSAEYNLGLGDRRASAARDFLTQLGVPAAMLKSVSYGKERPQCTDANEGCYQQNRRAHFSAGQ
jgi:peptidoglycan-associated lipoprotein